MSQNCANNIFDRVSLVYLLKDVMYIDKKVYYKKNVANNPSSCLYCTDIPLSLPSFKANISA